MARIKHYGHGIYCELCQKVYDGTDACDHRFDNKMGVSKDGDGYLAQPADMGHYSPHMFIEVDGMQQCGECGAVKVPADMVETENAPNSDTGEP